MLARLGACGADNLLNDGEQFQITLTGLEAELTTKLQEDTDFSLLI